MLVVNSIVMQLFQHFSSVMEFGYKDSIVSENMLNPFYNFTQIGKVIKNVPCDDNICGSVFFSNLFRNFIIEKIAECWNAALDSIDDNIFYRIDTEYLIAFLNKR